MTRFRKEDIYRLVHSHSNSHIPSLNLLEFENIHVIKSTIKKCRKRKRIDNRHTDLCSSVTVC